MSAVLFQTMPPLSPDEYRQLEASCLEHGIQVPIIVDSAGAVIDGHHRQKIAQEHGLYLPTETRDTLTDAEKTTLSISLNIDRRQLTREQRREIIAASIKADPNLSDRGHAVRTGSTHPTVAAVRREVEQVESFTTSPADPEPFIPAPAVNLETGEITEMGESLPTITEHTETVKTKVTIGIDGKSYPKPEPKPVPTGDAANQINAETMSKEIGHAIDILSLFENASHRTRVLTSWWPLGNGAVPPASRALFNPAQLRQIAASLGQLATEMESTNV